MLIYAGIDEAGYGPMFGPLLVGRVVLGLPKRVASDPLPGLWDELDEVLCRRIAGRRGRIVVNDSKKLKTAAAGVKHLELGALAFGALAGHRMTRLDHWLDSLGEQCHHDLACLPWYAPSAEYPWDVLPVASTAGEIAVARGMLAGGAKRVGLEVLDMGAAVVFEDRFNRMVQATRSKAATSFTFVAAHLQHIWQQFGNDHPTVIVDRQGGRTAYRELLAMTFPEARITILEECPQRSAYRLSAPAPGNAPAPAPGSSPGGGDASGGGRAMTVSFEVEADANHMPAALASMLSKYVRELLMARFNAYFAQRVPNLRPTAGYALDGRRFWDDLEPHLPQLGITRGQLCRLA